MGSANIAARIARVREPSSLNNFTTLKVVQEYAGPLIIKQIILVEAIEKTKSYCPAKYFVGTFDDTYRKYFISP
jgi:hypothetical protein